MSNRYDIKKGTLPKFELNKEGKLEIKPPCSKNKIRLIITHAFKWFLKAVIVSSIIGISFAMALYHMLGLMVKDLVSQTIKSIIDLF